MKKAKLYKACEVPPIFNPVSAVAALAVMNPVVNHRLIDDVCWP
jgi:hypothetical protein